MQWDCLTARQLSLCSCMAAAQPQAAPELDRSQFTSTLHLKALRLDARKCQEYVKALNGHLLHWSRIKAVVRDESDASKRLLLLKDSVTGPDLKGLPEDRKQLIHDAGIEIVDYPLTLDYSYWPADHILKKLLPEGSDVPSSFETVGHIAHLNIRDELIPYKHLIGQVILDKNCNIRTVVNKVGTITNDYRVFQMEVVAGEPQTETEVVQHKARFKLDFSKVYWNSRLEHEHLRLVKTFRPTDIVLDVMAGIGPFVVPAAQRHCKVYANDLNPDSYRYLKENVRINKVGDHVETYNMDGREFIRSLSSPGGPLYSQVVMNLPASAVSFLDAFRGACSDARWQNHLPTINVYTFSRGDEDEAGVRQHVEDALGGPLHAVPRIHFVREVAPNKRMLCVSFKLPVAVAAGTAVAEPAVTADQNGEADAVPEQPPAKKARTSPDAEVM